MLEKLLHILKFRSIMLLKHFVQARYVLTKEQSEAPDVINVNVMSYPACFCLEDFSDGIDVI